MVTVNGVQVHEPDISPVPGACPPEVLPEKKQGNQTHYTRPTWLVFSVALSAIKFVSLQFDLARVEHVKHYFS